jgi:hypothetical protein
LWWWRLVVPLLCSLDMFEQRLHTVRKEIAHDLLVSLNQVADELVSWALWVWGWTLLLFLRPLFDDLCHSQLLLLIVTIWEDRGEDELLENFLDELTLLIDVLLTSSRAWLSLRVVKNLGCKFNETIEKFRAFFHLLVELTWITDRLLYFKRVLIFFTDSLDDIAKNALKIDWAIFLLDCHDSEVLIKKITVELEVLLTWILRDQVEVLTENLDCVNQWLLLYIFSFFIRLITKIIQRILEVFSNLSVLAE